MRWPVAVCVCVLLNPLLFGQEGSAEQAQSISPGQTPAAELYGFSGRVVNSVTGEGVARAKVSFSSAQQRATLTGPDGSFHFAGVPAGEVSIGAEKPGYFAEYEMPHSGHAPQSAKIGPQTEPVVVKLVPAAVIVGTVRDESGEPVTRMPIQVFRSILQEGRRRWTSALNAVSNEEGDFRVPDLSPDTYLLRYGPRWTTSVFTEGKTKGFGAEYFPSAAAQAGAAPIKVSAGQVLPMEIKVREITPFTVSGTIAGMPQDNNAQVQVFDEDGEEVQAQSNDRVMRRDQFVLHFAAPGTYEVRVTARPASYLGAMFGEARLAVNAQVKGVTIGVAPMPKFTINVTENHVPKPSPDGVTVSSEIASRLQNFRLFSISENLPEISSVEDQKSKVINFPEVLPGTYNFDEAYPTGNWYVESANFGGRDILNEPFPVAVGQSGTIDVTVRDDGAMLKGKIEGLTGTPPRVLFQNRSNFIPFALLISDARPWAQPFQAGTEQGDFQFNGIAPGSYKLYAFDHIDEVEYMNPKVLEQYAADAVSVSFGAGEQKSVNVNLIHVKP